MAKEHLRLAYLAWQGGKMRLAEKNYRISKMIDAEIGAQCDEKTLADAEFELKSSNVSFTLSSGDPYKPKEIDLSISRTAALDSIRSLYLRQLAFQRVMWLAEQGMMKPLSADENKRWKAAEAKYCSPVTPPCWIMGSETDGPVGYGLTLEEEWEAGD
jgi:hypothetical protein